MIPKRLSRKKIFSSPILDLFLDRVKFSSGHIVEDYHFLKIKNDSVIIIVTNKLNEICFIKSPRYITQKSEIELPAGYIEKNENIIAAARREFLEETGYKVDRLNHIYTFNPANSISNQKAYILSGKIKSQKPSKKFDGDEVSSVEWLSKEKIRELISANKIMDGFSVIAILLFYYSEQA